MSKPRPLPRLGVFRALGHLLPREIRERVFEPALVDLALRWRAGTGRRRAPFPVAALGTLLGCVPMAVPRIFVRNGRLTLVGRGAVAAIALIVLAAAVVSNLPTYEP